MNLAQKTTEKVLVCLFGEDLAGAEQKYLAGDDHDHPICDIIDEAMTAKVELFQKIVKESYDDADRSKREAKATSSELARERRVNVHLRRLIVENLLEIKQLTAKEKSP